MTFLYLFHLLDGLYRVIEILFYMLEKIILVFDFANLSRQYAAVVVRGFLLSLDKSTEIGSVASFTRATKEPTE